MSGYTAAAVVASAVISAGVAYQSGQQQKAMGEYQADQAQADANAERSAAQVQAEKIRKLARSQVSSANASLAASGVEVGEGTALRITEDITKDAEEDATMTILNGNTSAAKTEQSGVAAKISGDQAATAGTLNAASSVLSGSYNGYTAWKRANRTT